MPLAPAPEPDTEPEPEAAPASAPEPTPAPLPVCSLPRFPCALPSATDPCCRPAPEARGADPVEFEEPPPLPPPPPRAAARATVPSTPPAVSRVPEAIPAAPTPAAPAPAAPTPTAPTPAPAAPAPAKPAPATPAPAALAPAVPAPAAVIDDAPAAASAAAPVMEDPPVTDAVPPRASVAVAASSPVGSHAASSSSSSLRSWRRAISATPAAASCLLSAASSPVSASMLWAWCLAAVGCACADAVRVGTGWVMSVDCLVIGAVFQEGKSVDRRDGDIRHRAGVICTLHDVRLQESAVEAIGRLVEGAGRVASRPEVAVTRRTRRPRPVRPGVGALFQAGMMTRDRRRFSPGRSRPEAVEEGCRARPLPRCPGSRPIGRRR